MPATITKKEILDKLHHLPALPLIVQEVIASFNDAELDIASLAHKIEQDQGLSAKVLRVANSSFYGLSRQVGSIQEGVIVLGLDTVRSIALSIGMLQTFPPIPGSLFDRQAYWQRSFRVATLADAQAKNLHRDQQLVFTAGMFHDIGQLVLDLCIPQQFSALLQRQALSNQPLLDIERAALGFDHTEIGAEVMRLWNFPPEIEQVVRYWHQPEQQETFSPLVCVIQMAVLLESGVSGNELLERLSGTRCGKMQSTWEVTEACQQSLEQLDATINLAQ